MHSIGNINASLLQIADKVNTIFELMQNTDHPFIRHDRRRQMKLKVYLNRQINWSICSASLSALHNRTLYCTRAYDWAFSL